MKLKIKEKNYRLIKELHERLDEEGIQHEYVRLYDGWQVKVKVNNKIVYDVVEFFGSYGLEGYNGCDIDGHMTVEEAVKKFKEHIEAARSKLDGLEVEKQ